MTNLVNLLRDQAHCAPGQSFIGWSARSTIGNSCKMITSGVVNQTIGTASHPYQQPGLVAINEWNTAGVLMSQPVIDSTPYRVKARITGLNIRAWFVVGLAPEAPTGTNDIITDLVAFPFYGEFDEVILIPGKQESDPEFDNPIALGCAISIQDGNPAVGYNISVQNLSKTAPQFASSVS